MRRLALCCLAITALSTTILTAGTQGATAAKSKQKDLMKSVSLADSTQGAAAVTKQKNTKSFRASTQSAMAATKKKNSAKSESLIAGTQVASTQGATAAKSKQMSLAKSEVASSDVVNEAKRWIGTNPTGWDHVWCARFMNFVLKRTGHAETGSNAASSFASYGRRVWFPQVGAIAVMKRGKNGGHVGVVSGFDQHGNPIVISGNHNRCSGNGRCVGVGVYPRDRIYAYVVPH
jgi:uncharacterized protein (TIGR02594 family)